MRKTHRNSSTSHVNSLRSELESALYTNTVKTGFHFVIIVVIQSPIIANRILQQLQLNENASRNCCNSIGNQSVTVEEVESG